MSIKSPGAQSLSGGGISGVLPGANGGTGVAVTTTTGSFTGTLTGFASGTTGTVTYRRCGNLVTLFVSANIEGTSNSTALTMTGLPAALNPTITQLVRCDAIEDNTQRRSGAVQIATNGTITFLLDTVSGTQIISSSSAFTNTGTKGILASWSASYGI